MGFPAEGEVPAGAVRGVPGRAPHGHQALIKPLHHWRIRNFPPNIYRRQKSAGDARRLLTLT
eukprot:3326018-Pyramimonas_sp.AAC.3